MRITRAHVLWMTMALLGLIVTAALTWSISRLTAQHIGLASAPVSMIRGLAPTHHRREAVGGHRSVPRQLTDIIHTSRHRARAQSPRGASPAAGARTSATGAAASAGLPTSSSSPGSPTGTSAVAGTRGPATAAASSTPRSGDSSSRDDSGGGSGSGRSPDD